MSNNKESEYKFPELLTTFPAPFVAHVQINRPKKYNAISPDVFHSLTGVFDKLSTDPDVRVVLLSGSGPHFSAGLDVTAASSSGPVSTPSPTDDIARRTWKARRHVYDYQAGMNAIERCEKPVICLLHGVAYGAAIDIAVAADVRYCAEGVKFSVKEVDVGLAADVGTLTRLPKIGVSYSCRVDYLLHTLPSHGEPNPTPHLVRQTMNERSTRTEIWFRRDQCEGTVPL